MDVITIGETMAAFIPKQQGLLRYNGTYGMKIAGAESNVAIGLGKLGRQAGWFSAVGDDEFGHFILNQIRGEGVDTSQVIISSEHRTGIMFKEIRPGKETSVYYYRDNSAASCLTRDEIPWNYLEQTKIIHLTGITPLLSQGLKDMVSYILDRMEGQVKISFDPNIRRKLWGTEDYSDMLREIAGRSSIIMMGMDEAQQMYGINNPDLLAERLLQNKRLEYLAIKDGARGAYVYDRKNQYYIAPVQCYPVDMIGAGDAFDAAFLAGILEGRDLLTCGNMGGIAGAMATEAAGDTEGYPFRQQMENRLSGGLEEEVYR